jgi:hypothetical protein
MVLAAGFVTAATGAPAQRVTLEMERYYDHACRCMKTRFGGAIASGASNEYVAVLGKRCGYKYSTQVAGATTREGGFWTADVNPVLLSSTTNHFRARWNGHLSEPLIVRSPIPVFLDRKGGGRYGVWFYSDTNMRGRLVELQRLTAGSWTRFRRKRLVRSPDQLGIYRAVFTVRERGLRLRFSVPPETAAPCYNAGASPTFST